MVGCSPLPVLDDLARDDAVRGVVIMEYFPYYIFNQVDPEVLPAAWAGGWRRETVTEEPPAPATTAWRLAAIHNPDYAWARLLRRIPFVGPPQTAWPLWEFNQDRERTLIFSYPGQPVIKPPQAVPEYRQLLEGISADPARIAAVMARIQADASLIRGHGGRLVVVRFPSALAARALEDQAMPSSRYWEPLTHLHDLALIDGSSQPALSRFDCGDMLHLDGRDAGPFTAALMDLVDGTLRDQGDARFATPH
jgi:hypothetical protein